MYKYVNDLLNFCENHIKNYSIIENTEDNTAIIRFENANDKFDMIIDYKDNTIDKIVVDKKEIDFDSNASNAFKINTMFKEIMTRIRV